MLQVGPIDRHAAGRAGAGAGHASGPRAAPTDSRGEVGYAVPGAPTGGSARCSKAWRTQLPEAGPIDRHAAEQAPVPGRAAGSACSS